MGANPVPIVRRAPYHDSEGRLRLPIDPGSTPALMPSPGLLAILDAVATASDVGRMVALAATEPEVVERLEALGESSLLGTGRAEGGVAGVVRELGAPALRDAALLVTVHRILGEVGARSFDVGRFREDAAVRACIAFAASRIAGYESPREAFTASLLQDFGVVVMGLLCPDRASQIDLCQARPAGERVLWERAIFGGSHVEVFAAYAQAWRLPPGMVKAIGAHHDEVIALHDRRTQRLAELLRLADAVSDVCQVGASDANLARARTKVAALASRAPLTLSRLLEAAAEQAPELARAVGISAPPVCTLESLIGAPTKGPPTVRAVRGHGARGVTAAVPGERTLRVEQLHREKERLARELRVNRSRVTLLSRVDPVTGVSSRRELCTVLANTVEEEGRRAPLSVVLVELEEAHQAAGGGFAGGLLLREAAARITGALRTEDVVGRIGSDVPAFGVLLPSCPDEFGPAVAQRIVDRLRASPVAVEGRVTAIRPVLGGTTVPAGADYTVEDIVAACERAVEAARAEGTAVAWVELEALPEDD